MEYLPINKIKPDPDQPRRTFNEEKMEALRASMKKDGFRKQYPIIINGGNTIVDGERRWRSAKAVGIKKVPVEVKHDVTPYERLIYQLQSEGAELETSDKYKAWARAYQLATKYGDNIDILAKKLGRKRRTIELVFNEYKEYESLVKYLSHKNVVTTFEENYSALAEIGRSKNQSTKKRMAEKAVKERWTQEKARAIRRAIKDKPMREKQILSQDYSDEYEGSGQWKLKLEVAKSDIDIKELEDMRVTRDKMFKQVDKWDDIMRSAATLRTSLDEFDFTQAPPEIRVKLHRTLTILLPDLTGYIKRLENYMLDNGELERNVKKIK